MASAVGPSGGGGAPGGGDDDESIVFYDVPPGKRARTEGGGANAAAAPRPAVWQDGIGFKLLTVSLPGQDGEIANRNAISMRDIVQNIGEIQWMLVSNFRLEVDFLVQQLPELVTVPKVFFLNNRQHEDEPDSGSCIKTFLRDNPALQGRFQVYCPAMPKFGTHHTKAFFIAYPTHMRVCIHTANLDEHDWSIMTQGAWMQDFPLKAPGAAQSTSEFETQLVAYFKATNWPGGPIPGGGPMVNTAAFKQYDYSGARVRLAASIPWDYPCGPAASQLWGHPRMRQILASERFDPEFVGAPVVWQFSSLSGICNTAKGALNRETHLKWVRELDASFSAGGVAGQAGQLGAAQNCRFVWPTQREVATCVEPETGGGMPSEYVNAVTKMALLAERRCRWAASDGQVHPEGRRRVMPHIKSFLRHRGQHLAWLYLGSSNLSRAAWGEVTGQGSAVKVTMKSFELGVVFVPSLLTGINGNAGPLRMVTTVSTEAAAAGGRAGVTPDGRCLALPVPYELSPVPYNKDDVPWYTYGAPGGGPGAFAL